MKGLALVVDKQKKKDKEIESLTQQQFNNLDQRRQDRLQVTQQEK
jgi:hypothetical protein